MTRNDAPPSRFRICLRCGQPESSRGPIASSGLCQDCASGRRPTTYVEPQRPPRPLHEPYAKLSIATVTEIRERHAGGHSMASLARRYGIHHSHVARIVRRESWKQLPMGPLEAAAVLSAYAPETVNQPPIPEGPAATVVPAEPDAPWNQFVGHELHDFSTRTPNRRTGWED